MQAMIVKTAKKGAKSAVRAKPVKTAKSAAGGKADKPAEPALAKPFSNEEMAEVFKLIKGASGVEMKLSVPLTGQRATIKGIGLDPVEAQPRQAFFFDTPDLA